MQIAYSSNSSFLHTFNLCSSFELEGSEPVQCAVFRTNERSFVTADATFYYGTCALLTFLYLTLFLDGRFNTHRKEGESRRTSLRKSLRKFRPSDMIEECREEGFLFSLFYFPFWLLAIMCLITFLASFLLLLKTGIVTVLGLSMFLLVPFMCLYFSVGEND